MINTDRALLEVWKLAATEHGYPSNPNLHMGFKKAVIGESGYALIILEIIGEHNENRSSKNLRYESLRIQNRSSNISDEHRPYAKMRCSKALVRDIINIRTYEKVTQACSIHDNSFKYVVGEVVQPTVAYNPLDSNVVCAQGIHYFLNPEAALMYGINSYQVQEGCRVKRYSDDGQLLDSYVVCHSSKRKELQTGSTLNLVFFVAFFYVTGKILISPILSS
jgi:hypothetical protein